MAYKDLLTGLSTRNEKKIMAGVYRAGHYLCLKFLSKHIWISGKCKCCISGDDIFLEQLQKA